MISFKFVPDTNRRNALRLRITNNRKKAELYLGIQLSPDDLEDALSDKPSMKNVKWKSLLSHYQSIIDTIRIRLLESGHANEDPKVIKDLISQELFGNNGNMSQITTFISYYESFVDGKTNKGTRGVYTHTLSRMRAFDPDVDSLKFEDIDLTWLTNFERFLARTASKNARNIHLRNIRAVFNNAIDNDITTVYPFRRFKIRPEATRKRSLSVEDLRRLFDYPVEPYAEIYRDCFKLIFMLIGINAVDLYGLTEVSRDGRVEYRRAKTHKLYSIKVEPEALELIERYRGERMLLCLADRWNDHRNFTHQCNKALQKIGEVERKGLGGKKIITAEFEGLTTYWARHTWATIAADLDIPDAVISQALGHAASNSTTEIYIRRNQRKVDEANRRVLDWVLYGKQ